MSDLVKIDPQTIALVRGLMDGKGALKPFVQEIMLIECHVAGTTHVDIEAVEPDLKPGSILHLKREPRNKHDPRAIVIFDDQSRRIGYIPERKNEALANLMDAGKLLFGKLEKKEWRGNWLRVSVRVFMQD